MERAAMAGALRAEVEDFFYREAELLDGWRLDEWESMLAYDVSYYVPPNDRPDADHRDTLFTIADDPVRLHERIIRLKDPTCHAEYPRSRTRRLITNVRIIDGLEGEVTARANFVVYRHRRGSDMRVFTGEYRYRLVRTDGVLKIRERRAVLDAEELGPMGSVSFIL